MLQNTSSASILIDHLKYLIDHQKLPHAILFEGAEGIGKLESADQIARHLLKDNYNAELHLFKPESAMHNYTIDQVRKIQDICMTTPYNGENRVIILDHAHRLGLAPSNAFLKILEEPPPGNFFILLTSCSYKLLPTLLSRLQKYQFIKPHNEEFLELLKNNNIDLGVFAFLAEGSLGKAYVVKKYLSHLEPLSRCLCYSYTQEITSYRSVFEQIDEDETFKAFEFLPLFEALMRDLYAYSFGYKQAIYPWERILNVAGSSYFILAECLKQLNLALDAGMKPSSGFERFFLNLSLS